ncbi:hypothetical protein BGAL_0454g00100 [Botrytis galanthina]|uniref:Uncharacterized protein n=1 Tax=Botrytis galanthina TaxID=278940 RepID=A0A4S8QY71_9HELO|nr:hypothetical protein BGAL_0454g00100 [Botrytis galanthina]
MVLLNSVTVDTSLKGVSCGDGVVIPVAVIDNEEVVEAAAVRDLLYEHVAGVKVVQELSAGIYVDTAVSHSMLLDVTLSIELLNEFEVGEGEGEEDMARECGN